MKLKRPRQKLMLVWIGMILFLAGVIRLYRVNEVPMGYTWDEASIMYNSWSLSEWRRDENAELLPLAFKSFGDYKPPFVMYWMAWQYWLVGLIPELLRINTALFGIGTVVLSMLIAHEMGLPGKKNEGEKYHLILWTGLLMAVLPWGIQFSRIGFEQTFAYFWILTGIYFLLRWRRGGPGNVWVAATGFGLSLYSFHTARVFVPVFLIGYAWFFRREIAQRRREALAGLWWLGLLVVPLVYASYTQAALTRAGSLIVFDREMMLQPVSLMIQELWVNIKHQVSLGFFVNGWDAVSMRHAVPGFGVLLRSVLGFLIIGVGRLMERQKRTDRFLLFWLVAGLVPALVAHLTPHALRSLFALTPVALIASAGIEVTIRYIANRSIRLGQLTALLIIGVLMIEFFGFARVYFGDYARMSAIEFQYGYQEVIVKLNDLVPRPERVVFSPTYGEPYIYVLLFEEIPARDYLWGGLNRYQFRKITWPERQADTVYIASPEEIPPLDPAVIEVITVPGTNQPVFVMAKT